MFIAKERMIINQPIVFPWYSRSWLNRNSHWLKVNVDWFYIYCIVKESVSVLNPCLSALGHHLKECLIDIENTSHSQSMVSRVWSSQVPCHGNPNIMGFKIPINMDWWPSQGLAIIYLLTMSHILSLTHVSP